MGVPVPGMRANVKYHKGWVRVVIRSSLGLCGEIFYLCPSVFICGFKFFKCFEYSPAFSKTKTVRGIKR